MRGLIERSRIKLFKCCHAISSGLFRLQFDEANSKILAKPSIDFAGVLETSEIPAEHYPAGTIQTFVLLHLWRSLDDFDKFLLYILCLNIRLGEEIRQQIANLIQRVAI